MRFEWDEEKRRVNLEKHGIDFVDAVKLFNRPVIVSQDQKKDYGEKRFACYGYLGKYLWLWLLPGENRILSGLFLYGKLTGERGGGMKKQSQTDMSKLRNMRDEDIDYSDIPDYGDDAAFWARAEVVLPKSKVAISIRLDQDVLEWFKAQGHGYQARINAVLRAYKEAHRGS
jgi:uncharacterized protein (DUF4415 family)/uncharacterized DUF497 family protein